MILLILQGLRELIKNRDQMEKESPGSVATVELSHEIRTKLKTARADAASLDQLQKDEKEKYIKKNKEIPDQEELIERRYHLSFLPQTSPLE